MDYDMIQIQIEAEAQKANSSIDLLISKLDKLSVSLTSFGKSPLQTLASGVERLGRAVKTIDTTSTANLSLLSKDLQKLNNVNLSSVSNSANSFYDLNKGMYRTTATMKQTKGVTLGLASAFGKFYATFFLVIRAVKKFQDAIGDTANYIESFNYFTVAFEKVATDWKYDFENYGKENAQAYADSFIERINQTLGKLSGINVTVSADGEGLLTATNVKNLGLNIQEVTQYVSQLASITNAVGQTGETTLAVSDAFTKLAGDISSLFNVDYSSVAKNLQSGLIGQSRALYKYGIDITNATLQTLAYELGIEKAVSEMTQMEKQQLRVISILRQSKVSWGDLANTINSPSNMIRQLSTNLKEASMVLGQLFIPLMTKVLPIINGLAIALKNVLVDFANLAGVKINFSEFGQGYNEAEEGLNGIEDGIEGVNGSLKKANKSLRSFDELLTIGTENQNMSETQDMLDLTEEILKATEEYNSVWNSAFSEMENKAQEFADKIYSVFTSSDWSSVGEKLGEGLVTFINNVDEWINKIDWQKLGSQITTVIDGLEVEEIVISIGKLLFDVSRANFGINWGALKSTYEKYGLIGVFTHFLGFSSGAGLFYRVALNLGFDVSEETGVSDWFNKNIKEPIDSKVAELTTSFNAFSERIKENFKNAWEKITGFFTEAKEKITKTWVVVSDWFSKNVTDPIAKTFEGTKERITTAFEGAKTVVQGVWESISKLFTTKVLIPLTRTLKTIGLSISTPFTNAWNAIKQVWAGAVEWFDTNLAKPVGKLFENITYSFKTMFSNLWTSMLNGIKETINNVISVIEGGINFIIDGVNNVIEKYNEVVRWFDKDYVGVRIVPNVEFSRISLPSAQVGINPLLANQIEKDLINKGIYGNNNVNMADEIGRATYDAIKQALDESASNASEQTTIVQIDGNEVFNVVQKRANNYFNATGNSAFAY